MWLSFWIQFSTEGIGDINIEELTVSKFPNYHQVKTLRDLEARYKTGCTVIGFKTIDGNYVINPGADTVLQANSKLFVLGKPAQIIKLNKLLDI